MSIPNVIPETRTLHAAWHAGNGQIDTGLIIGWQVAEHPENEGDVQLVPLVGRYEGSAYFGFPEEPLDQLGTVRFAANRSDAMDAVTEAVHQRTAG